LSSPNISLAAREVLLLNCVGRRFLVCTQCVAVNDLQQSSHQAARKTKNSLLFVLGSTMFAILVAWFVSPKGEEMAQTLESCSCINGTTMISMSSFLMCANSSSQRTSAETPRKSERKRYKQAKQLAFVTSD